MRMILISASFVDLILMGFGLSVQNDMLVALAFLALIAKLPGLYLLKR